MNFSLFLLLFVVSTHCQQDNENTVSRRLRKYRFNHPPSVNYDPIPVAVVFDVPNEDRSNRKSVKNIMKITTTTEAITTTVETTEAETSTIDEEDVTTVSTETPEPRRIKAQKQYKSIKRIQPGTEFQIPVAIVYDDDQQDVKEVKRRKILRRVKTNKVQNQEVVRSTEKSNTKESIDKVVPLEKEIPDIVKMPVQQNSMPVESVEINEQKAQLLKISTTSKPTQRRRQGSTTEANRNVSPKLRKSGEKLPVIPIVESESYLYSHGNFRYSYESGDGTKAFEESINKSVKDNSTGEAVVGGYSYKDKDGHDFSLTYTADENGYRPVGAHLPTPPPIPPAIARALKYLATKPTPVYETVTESE